MDIDIVIPWVDGNDPQWRELRSKYTCETGDSREARYRDWGLMRYWFRGVEKFAPWVRKIHFVTWGHVPDWLDTDNPKLHIVKHEDYIPQEYLPTFNGHPIELNIHRIEDLAEHFVYFNDDIFIVKSLSPNYFFKKGLPCDCFSLQSICFNPNAIGWINGSDISIINKYYPMRATVIKLWKKTFSPKNGIKKVIKTFMHFLCHPWFPGLYYNHTVTPFLKSTFTTLWEKEPDVLDETCRCKFREKTNVNQFLFKYWQLASGEFMPSNLKLSRCFHLRARKTEFLCKCIRNQTYGIICINDVGVIEDVAPVAEKIGQAFAEILPERSSFEKY